MDASLYARFYEVEEKHWWFVARRKIVEHLVRELLRIPPGAAVLDVGCGTGAILQSLAATYNVYGTDTSALAAEFSKKRGLKNVFQCTLENFPLRDHRFRLITMLDVIEHIEDEHEVLRQASGMLSPGGVILITVPAYQWLWSRHDDLNHHKRRYTKNQLLHTLQSSGLHVTYLSYFNTLLFPLAVVQRIWSKLVPSSVDEGMNIPSPIMNNTLERIFRSERKFLGAVSVPFGLSLLAIATAERPN